jgi:hypothetical protein
MASLPPDLRAGPSAYVQPRAGWRVVLDGQDLTARLAPLLIGLRLSERDGEEADQLEITLDDSQGRVAIPPAGARLQVWLGWERGTEVSTGLVFKGAFKVDEAGWSGPPDRITLTARSADLADSFRTRRNRIWKDGTLADIVGVIATEHGLDPRCHADLAARAIAVAEQGNKSDMQFLRDLARRYDASAVVKAGCLIFAPKGAATTAMGTPVPAAVLLRSRCSQIDWRRAARESAQDGAEAQWHDPAQNRRQTHTTGGSNPKRLKRVYGSQDDARAAATAETNRLKRAAASLSATLAWGNPLLSPGMRITASGFKAAIDQTPWLIASAEHTMDAGGLRTRIEMEVAG